MLKNGKLKIEKNDDAINTLERNGRKDDKKLNRLIALVTDYKKSIGRPQPIQLELF